MLHLLFHLALIAPLPQEAAPTVPVDGAPAAALAPAGHHLVVKFKDDRRVRADAAGRPWAAGQRALPELERFAAERGLRFAPHLDLPEARLAELEARARAASGLAPADLAGHLRLVRASTEPAWQLGVPEATLEAWAAELRRFPEVEWAELEAYGLPPPGDIPPTTPNLQPQQTYLGPDPGVQALYAWGQLGLGSGVRISDCEYGWNPAHEDLVDIPTHPEPGQTIPSFVFQNGWEQHGTAVLGQLAAPHNGYGVSGMAPAAAIYTYPEWSVQQGPRRATCIANAIADSAAGDVVLLEMQANGAGGGFGPAELDGAVYNVVRAGVLAGVIVVGAAGNGNQNLDAPAYASYMAKPNSGALLIGAGSASAAHSKLAFSTFGSRVDLQAWGESVLTLGYGSAFFFGGDNNQKYTYFSGTSSASPFVAAAAAILSGLHQQYLGNPPSPAALRNLLRQTGKPQTGGGGAIGPALDLQAAINALGLGFTDLGLGQPGSAPLAPKLSGQGVLAFGTPFGLALAGAPAFSLGYLVLGTSRVDLPLSGALLVPAPDQLIPLFAGPTGTWSLTKTLNANSPGTSLWLQCWSLDPSAPQGVAVSNALEAELH
jgi:hypothetical protein